MSRTPAISVAVLATAAALCLAGCSAPAATPAEPTSIFDEGLSEESTTTPEETPADEEVSPADLSSIDPCALLPKAEAEALAQVPFLDPIDTPDASQPNCQYNTDPDGGTTGQATLNLGPGAEQYYGIDVGLDHVFEDVPGLGDEAHLEDFTIFVRKGDLWFSVAVFRLEDAALFKQGLIDAATAVAGRL